MKDFNKTEHSFLFWLLVPLLISWFAFNYVKAVLFFRGENTPQRNLSANGSIAAENKNYPPLPKSNNGYVTLWFDDAWTSQYTKGAEVLREYGFTGTLAVPTLALETDNYMNWAQVKILADEGWEITNHSQVHDCQMQNWSRDKIRDEFKYATTDLWKRGLNSDIFVTPCGVTSEIMIGEAIKQFSAYRTVDPGINDLETLDKYNIKVRNIDDKTTFEDIQSWINQTKENGLWLVFVFHQIGIEDGRSDSEKYGIDLELFRRLLDEVKNSGAEVVVPSQILQEV